MAFRASSSRLNTQRQHSGSLRDFVEDGSQLAALPVQRRRTSQGRLKRAGSLGKFEKKGHYEACGTVKVLLAAAQTADVTHLEQAFLAEGYDVVLAQDAQGVLEAVKTSPHPDLVLMNYTLPGLTGSQVVRAIRRMHPDLPIFAMSKSGDSTAAAIKQDLYGGAVQDWLRLPVDDGEAIARTEGALRHQYGVVKKLRNEVLVLRGEIDALQRMQQENILSAKLEPQQSV